MSVPHRFINPVDGLASEWCGECGIHRNDAETFDVECTQPVTTRPAQCTCGRQAALGTPISQLAFYEHRGPGTCDDRCANCRYNECAHGREDRSRFVCDNFQPMTDGYPYDLYYCGHGGWD